MSRRFGDVWLLWSKWISRMGKRSREEEMKGLKQKHKQKNVEKN